MSTGASSGGGGTPMNQQLLTKWLAAASSPALQHADEHALSMLVDAINSRPE